MELTTEANEVLENLKMRHRKILEWDNYKIINHLSEHWDNRKSIQEKLTDEAINRVKAIELKEREDNDTKEIIIDDDIIGNSDEKNKIEAGPTLEELNINSAGIKARSIPYTTNLSVLTSVFDHGSGKWLESRRATHPFISVKITKIDPRNQNRKASETTTQCLMADSGAM